MRMANFAAFLVLLALVSVNCHSDTLLLFDAIESSRSSGHFPPIRRGMSKERVLALSGEPSQRVPAVGEPPISRWVYPTYTVFFEYGLAITAVQHRRNPSAVSASAHTVPQPE